MAALCEIVVFRLGAQRYALRLDVVRRVLPMAEFAPFPKAPEIVLGVLNVAGAWVPVLDVRRRFRQPSRAVRPEDQLIVARLGNRDVALAVDEVSGVETCAPDAVESAERVVPGLDYVRGIVKLADGETVFIHDLETFLSLNEARALDAAAGELAPA